ncbi:TPA: DUF1643 domain-containing protein [Vibrio parahaemolyticus]
MLNKQANDDNYLEKRRLFAYRATQPEDMKRASDPIGDKNDNTLIQLAKNAGVIVGAWGNDGVFLNRSEDVRALIPELNVLKVNKSGVLIQT